MSFFTAYLDEIKDRKTQGLSPKPIEDSELALEVIAKIKDVKNEYNEYREQSLEYFIYNTLPGTTNAAGVKAEFLKEIILGNC